MLGSGAARPQARASADSTSKPWVKTSLAPGSRVVTDYFKKAGVLEDLEALGFDLVGYGCTTCIAEGTPVLLADGTARRIEALPRSGGARLIGPNGASRLVAADQTEMMVQGERECVTLVLQDGRTLVCTPDHEILCADRRWVRADRLVPGQDRVLMGLEAPVDEPGADEKGYRLSAGERVLLHGHRAWALMHARVREAPRAPAQRWIDQPPRASAHERRSGVRPGGSPQ